MKRRSRAGRQRTHYPRRKAHSFVPAVAAHKRKSFTFERLEDRLCFSTTPLDVQTVSISSDTAEGAAALWLRELQWAALQSASRTGAEAPQYTTFALPNDPLFTSQWHLLNTGQEVGNPDFQTIYGVAGEDINVVPAWNLSYTGEGVLIAVNDTGVQGVHPDLKNNLHPTLRYNAITGTNNASPNLTDPGAPHGTAVAGLIAATANNGIGGSGVAPGATIVPVLLIGPGTTSQAIARAFNFATQNGVDITNNSWGPGAARVAVAMTPAEVQTLRDSILFGRDGLGIVHVFASGNSGGPAFNPGFQGIGNWDSSNYDGYVNSRYVITVTGVDHDGLYANDDGTFTAYPEAGTNVLVASPTGSNAALNIADDTGLGSGIWTTDLVDDFGYNAEPLPSGFDPDRDFLADPDYTSRFNGTSAASPIAAGVIALMLEANPNLTYRDVQEILVRSARQNAQFEVPASGGSGSTLQERPSINTWQTNQIGFFRNPDPYIPLTGQSPFLSIIDPIADPNKEGFFIGGGSNAFPTRADLSHYEPQPGLYTNGAGYTVSQGYGVYAEMTGYGHGVIDAGLAVQMAEKWHTFDQELPPERTYSTFVVQAEPQSGWTFPAAEKTDDPPDGIAMVVPGGIGGIGGYIDYWNEYFAEDDPADPDDGPFSDYDGPHGSSRGASYWQFQVPDNQSINVEWVEVKVSLGGPADDLDFIRINLVSPEGTMSELNHYYADPEIVAGVHSYQVVSTPAGDHDPPGDIGTGGQFVWTFSTNRIWGETTKTATIIDPATGEPLLERDFAGQPIGVFRRGWELHMENWSSSDYTIDAVEIVWHGKPIETAAQRVQGFVGIDRNSDESFNYARTNTFLFDSDFDQGVLRTSELVNQLDLNQEPFAENILVEAFRVVNGVKEDQPIQRFLTGADGNYYFDLVPGDYIIRATDPQERVILEDTTTDPMFLKHFRREWVINADWFYAPDRDLPVIGNEVQMTPDEQLQYIQKNEYTLGEIFYDATTKAPVKFEYMANQLGTTVTRNVPSGVKNLNFLIKEDAQAEQIVINGTVFADVNGNGKFDSDDTPAGGVFVYADTNRNGVRDSGEQTVMTSEDPLTRGQYSMTIFADHLDTYAVGVVPPSSQWVPTNPADAVLDLFAGPGAVLNNVNFFLDPPDEAFPPAGANEPGNILGVVYSDGNENRLRDLGEVGIPGFRVYIDADEDGRYDAGEQYAITSSNGSFLLSDVPPGIVRIDVEIENEGTDDASWVLTAPLAGFRLVQLGPGGTVSGVQFGLGNRADQDWGDLPSSYGTRAGDSPSGGPSHVIIPGFQLGGAIDGEVNGQPTPNADGDDVIGQDEDGVRIRTNNGVLQLGVNVLDVTVLGVGGYLNGWIDLNGDGQFGIGEQVITDLDLNPGVRQVTVNLPAGTVDGPLAARFRWGERGLGSTGPAGIGEVEDYFLPNSIAQSAVLAGDYDLNGTVNDDDYAIWRATFGTSDLRADGNGNGIVDLADYVVWRNNLGATTGTGTASGDLAAQGSLSLAGVTYGNAVGFVVQGTVGSHTSASLASVAAGSQVADAAVAVATSPFLFDLVDFGVSVAAGPSSVSTLIESSAAVSVAAKTNLLLVDEALSALDRDDDVCDGDARWTCDQDDDASDDATELALAAVLEDDWWATL